MFDKQIYVQRRKRLHDKMSGGIAVFPGNDYVPYNYPANPYRFRQDSSFLYYFGLNQAGLTAVMDFDSGEDYLFGEDIDIDDIIWMGEQPSIKELAVTTGITGTGSLQSLAALVKKAVAQGRKIHLLPPYRAKTKLFLQSLLDIPAVEITAHSSIELIRQVVEMRLIKEQVEIDYLDKIMDTGYDMHVTAMLMAKEGMSEQEITGAMEGIAVGNGGYVSFPIILSKHGEILHNEKHDNILKNGDLLLVDAGFDSPEGYATDHTRTFAVGGKFSQKQKDIYNIVLAANEIVHEKSRPGVTYRDMHYEACRVIASGLKQLGLMKGDIEEAVSQGAHALFMPHGLGHALGLDVHDMEGLGENIVGYTDDIKRSDQFGTAYLRFARRLEPGHVVTNEPGIYFIPALIEKWHKEGLHHDFINYEKVRQYLDFGGIRLEDDIVITEDSCRNLGKTRIPIYPEQLEEIVGKG